MLSLLIVNYRSAVLAVDAIRSARAGTSQPLEVVVVDNSCDAAEAAVLRPHCDVLVVSSTNRGYGGAINDGRAHCHGDVLVVANPDVIFAADALDLLAGELSSRTAAAGPALFWDSEWEWILPPGELHTAWDKFDQILSTRSAGWFRWRDRRRIRKRMTFWSLTASTPVRSISGAVMAFDAASFDAVGGFDERFPLYFEETDLLRRLTAARKRIVYVPGAHCRHIYDQSAAEDRAHASTSYAKSELRYLEKWNGPWLARTLKQLERPPRPRAVPTTDAPIELDEKNVLIEISPSAAFDTAAGHFPLSRQIDIPVEAWESYRGDALYLRVIDRRTGGVIASFVRYKD